MESLLKCSVCNISFHLRSPKILSCTHTFCLNCLNNNLSANRTSVICIQCKRETFIPVGGVAGLMTNAALKEMAVRMNEQKEAEENFTCKEHSKPLELFCEDCMQLICMVCGLKGHKSHNFDTIEKVFDSYNVGSGSRIV